MLFYLDIDYGFHQRASLPKYRKNYPKRLKSEGTDLGNFYNALALDTIGETMWYEMKNGNLNWTMIDDRYFKIAEILGEQLETYDPDEEKKVEIIQKKEEIIPDEEPTKFKKKKKRDRRIKIKDH